MTKRYYLSEKDVKKQREVNRRVLAGKVSRRPVPTRRPPRMGGGGGGGLRWGQATSSISAATGWDEADWGSGTVQFYHDDGTTDGAARTVDNLYRDAFDDNSIVCCEMKYDPPRIVAVGCTVGT